jgi:formate dehydrogenase subunit gamma
MMLVLFVFHVLLAAVVPWSWPLLKSMFSGWVPLDFAREHHPVWYEQLEKEQKE